MRHPGFLLAAVCALLVAPAFAQAPGDGLLNAVAYDAIPTGAAVAVRPLDNSDDNMVLKEEFERELRARGYVVAADAALILSFETRGTTGAWTSGERRYVLELRAQGGREGGEDASARVNVFDSAAGGLLNPGRGGTTSIVTPSQYRLDATVDDRASGRRLWQGWAVADLEHADGLALTRAMVPAVAASVGRTVRRQVFAIP